MNIRYFFVRYRLDKKEITVNYFSNHLMVADYFTNPLQGKAFKLFCDVIMGYAHINTFLAADLPIKEHVEKGKNNKMIEKSTVPFIEKESEN